MMCQPPSESLEEMADATASGLAQAAAGWAFQLFGDKQFRRLAAFEQLSQVEQDRIFNELVIAGLVLIMLLFEAPDLRLPSEFQEYLADVTKRMPRAYVDQLRALGLEAGLLRTWDDLIEMRYQEYARDRHDVRAAAMRLEASEKPLDVESLSKIQLTVPLQAVAIGAHHHICRGQVEGRDGLFKLLLDSLSRFYVELRVQLEGGKITPLARARVAVKRTLRRLRKKR